MKALDIGMSQKIVGVNYYNYMDQKELETKITQYEKILSGLEKNGMKYSQMLQIVNELKSARTKKIEPKVTLHRDDGAGVCESCQ